MKRFVCPIFLILLTLHACLQGAYGEEASADTSGRTIARTLAVSTLQIGVGTATAFLGFIAGAFAAGLISLPFIHSGEGLELLGPIVIGGCAGLDLGCAVGVCWTGRNCGIQNTYGSAVLGGTLGFIAGAVLSNRTDDMAFLFVLPAAFATLVYNAFATDEPAAAPAANAPNAFQESGTADSAFAFRTSRYAIRFDLVRIAF